MLKKCSSMLSNIPSPPVYDGKESTIQYERRVADYLAKINKLRYDVILEFLNIYMSKNYAKLKDFSDIDEKMFLNVDHNKYMYDTYSGELNKNLIISESDYISDNGNINFILYIQKILSKINYVMIKKRMANIRYFYLKQIQFGPDSLLDTANYINLCI